MIQVDDLSHQVVTGDEQLHILSDINLQINDGETVAITGSSGSGKTTLLGMLAGLDVPSTGNIRIDSQCISAMTEDQRAEFRAAQVGFVFQSFHLLAGLSALDNVMLPLELAGVDNARGEAEAFLEQVGLGHRLRHHPTQLSGGEQQRVAIARAFASRPKYLFADEPTGNLDAATGEKIIELLFALNQSSQATLVMVTHEERLAALCQRHLVIERGRLSDVGGGRDKNHGQTTSGV
ncbi:Lipoprotein-releasing system ATP-binding protein LolD [BD1-7 clade bacterium]|uniref:Lipoprotein-releasing system ATP-binding protein LolD n=1 Tax=BD1-7 clade bacterium TaxID=2029982 RepID=A0A5S9PVQ5_9GAMM|nr:Lipoprotein-releasing system ATP-binding protein LolD [BD1-7 clade bacterium]